MSTEERVEAWHEAHRRDLERIAKDRLERIATAVFAAMAGDASRSSGTDDELASGAILMARALIAELDKP